LEVLAALSFRVEGSISFLLYLLICLSFHIIALYGAETWMLRQQTRNTWKVLKCGAGEGWRRSVGPIM
jgi:hypothetical protein